MHHQFLLVNLANICTLLLDIPYDLDRPTIALIFNAASHSLVFLCSLLLAYLDQLNLKRLDPWLLGSLRLILMSVCVVVADWLLWLVRIESAQSFSRKSLGYPFEGHLYLILDLWLWLFGFRGHCCTGIINVSMGFLLLQVDQVELLEIVFSLFFENLFIVCLLSRVLNHH